MQSCRVITVSDRCAAGLAQDVSGSVLVSALVEAGYEVTRSVVPDGKNSVRQALLEALDSGARLVVTTGGTGVGPRDRTPEGTREVLDRQLPGVAELIRADGAQRSSHAALTRGIAGVVDAVDGVGGAFVVNLPGSPRAAGEGIAVVLPLVDHILDQLAGGDH
ncbi:MAG: MogA/MoaB family molybdenum cofactor biosynthesis protein [Actinobacteria bacterium]|nr:MogA/MoaB family molybdenum cofactor biosynthesis protein [Actinomycetota bacterium]